MCMRSLFSFSESKENPVATGGGNRPEILRRKTLANNSRLLILFGLLGLPFSIHVLLAGSPLPFALAMMGLAAGMITLSLHRRRLFDEAAAGQVYALLVLGCILALADGRLSDVGLAVAVMAPILASLQGGRTLRRQSWVML